MQYAAVSKNTEVHWIMKWEPNLPRKGQMKYLGRFPLPLEEQSGKRSGVPNFKFKYLYKFETEFENI
jgi:hypothetical protein